MSEVINLNSANPAAETGSQNISFAKGGSTGTDPTTGLPIFPVSASVPIATDSQLGIVQPDGTTITIEDGVISAVGGGGSSVFYGNASGGASAGNTEVILGSIPVTGSLSIFVGGTILPPNQWSIPSGSMTATLTTALTAGQVVVATWATTNSTPGGITIASPGVPTPIEQWLMNEGSGETFFTSSSSGDNIGASNITWASVAGFPGTVPVFNGSNASGAGVNQTNTNFTGTTPFTISLWALLNSAGEQGTLVSTFDGSDIGWEVSLNGPGQTLGLQLISSSGELIILANSAPSAGTIHHFCTTYDGSRTAPGVVLYIDGVAQSVTVFSNNLAASIANAQPVVIGARSNNTELFSGNMADLRIYDVAFTSGQVSTLFSDGPA